MYNIALFACLSALYINVCVSLPQALLLSGRRSVYSILYNKGRQVAGLVDIQPSEHRRRHVPAGPTV